MIIALFADIQGCIAMERNITHGAAKVDVEAPFWILTVA